MLDEEAALKNCGNNLTLLLDMLSLTVQQIPADLERMKAAYANQDFALVEKIAHKIKGGAVYVGTTRMKYACQYLERYWKAGERELFDELYHQAVKNIEETSIYLTDWLYEQQNR